MFLRGVSRENKNPTLDVGNKLPVVFFATSEVSGALTTTTTDGRRPRAAGGRPARGSPRTAPENRWTPEKPSKTFDEASATKSAKNQNIDDDDDFRRAGFSS